MPAGSSALRLGALVGGAEPDQADVPASTSPDEQHGEDDLGARGYEASPASDRGVLARLLGVVDRLRKGTFSRSTLWPSSASTASSSEFAMSTVVRTPSALPIPSFVTKSRPMNASPVTEIATVSPAKITARPADAPASAAASRARAHRGAAAGTGSR